MLAIHGWVCIDSSMDTTDTSLSASVLAAGNAVETIGRYSRADLEAMHGKRGRKPPEYFTLFPERVRAAPTPRKIKVAEASLNAVGGYEADPLAARLHAASPAVRRLVSDLLDVVGVSLVSLYRMPCRIVWYTAVEAAPVSESTPVPAV